MIRHFHPIHQSIYSRIVRSFVRSAAPRTMTYLTFNIYLSLSPSSLLATVVVRSLSLSLSLALSCPSISERGVKHQPRT